MRIVCEVRRIRFWNFSIKPNPNESCDIRDSAAVSPQAFSLLNSEMITDRSLALAVRLGKEADSLSAQIIRGFELALGRHPRLKRTTTPGKVCDGDESLSRKDHARADRLSDTNHAVAGRRTLGKTF